MNRAPFIFIERAEETDAGQRLDVFCARRHPEVSRSRLSELIHLGSIVIDGQPAKPSERIAAGQEIRMEIPPLVERVLQPEAIPLEVLFQDPHLIVLNKAAGLVVHPGAGIEGGTLAAALLHLDPNLAGVGGEGRAGLVHRLDRGTSGVMVVAREATVHRALQDQFRGRSVEKIYHALVWGRPREREGDIDLPVGRDPRSRVKMSTRSNYGREAHSQYRVRNEVPGFAFLEVQIHTGRTHQVRVHLAALGHPVIGDETYGGARAASVADPLRRKAVKALDRPALHAFQLGFLHPVTGERLSFTAPWPEDLVQLWRALGGTPP